MRLACRPESLLEGVYQAGRGSHKPGVTQIVQEIRSSMHSLRLFMFALFGRSSTPCRRTVVGGRDDRERAEGRKFLHHVRRGGLPIRARDGRVRALLFRNASSVAGALRRPQWWAGGRKQVEMLLSLAFLTRARLQTS